MKADSREPDPSRRWAGAVRVAPILPAERIGAAVVACAAIAGLIVQFAVMAAGGMPVWTVVWRMVWFFTILANLLLVGVFGALAALGAKRVGPQLVGCAVLSILLVGVIYGLLLTGLRELSGGSALANALLHYVTPVLAPVAWLIFTEKGRLRRVDPLIWSLFPWAYLIYVLLRGAATGTYPYPFIDVAHLGWAVALRNAVVIAAGYCVAGEAFVGLDRSMGRMRIKRG